MGSCTENHWFKLFAVVVFLSHCVQFVWNSPLPESFATTTVQSALKPIQTYPNVEVYKAKRSQDTRTRPNTLNNESPVTVKAKPQSAEQSNALCSFFMTFLANGNQKLGKCKVNSVFEVKSNPIVGNHEKEAPGLIELLQASGSNHINSIQDSSSRIDILGETFDGYADITGNEAKSVTSRIPHPQYGPSSSGYDETKVFRQKSAIIVPEYGSSCPYGQRKDYYGYCRTIVRFNRPVFHPSQFVPSKNVGPPLTYYYKKYISVPTLHFIIPSH